MFGVDISNVKREDAGLVLGDAIRKFLHSIDVPDGIGALGFKNADIEKLVLGTLPQVCLFFVDMDIQFPYHLTLYLAPCNETGSKPCWRGRAGALVRKLNEHLLKITNLSLFTLSKAKAFTFINCEK